MFEQVVQISPDGRISFIWDDELAVTIGQIGRMTVRRASYVEPTLDGQWEADLSLSGGPKLGPFPLRGDALAAEIEWLRSNGVA